MTDADFRTTPLYGCHQQAGARFIDFGGWRMPVQYAGIMAEHKAVREAAGLFDISHMGQVTVAGDGAEPWLNRMLSNNLERIEAGECQYTFLLNERGGVIDDLLAYRLVEGGFLLVINASKRETDLAHLRSHLADGVELTDRSDRFAGLALQGRRAAQVFDAFFGENVSRPSRNQVRRLERAGTEYLVARTGYTGEDGFELFFDASAAAATWDGLLAAGAPAGLQPCGLGARDTLRLEMCYPLNGSDLSPEHTPLEAGLSFFVDLEKPEFIGRKALLAQREAGVTRRLVPFRMTEKCPPPRAHYPVYKNGEAIAETTSGNLSPTLNVGIGLAYIPAEFARINEDLQIDIRGRRFAAVIEKKPLHRPL